MSEIIKRVKIEVPLEETWKVLVDFGGLSKWAPNIAGSRVSGELGAGKGARRILHHETGRAMEEVITSWDDGEGYVLEIPAGFGPIKTQVAEWAVEAVGIGSAVTVRTVITMRFGPLGVLLDAAMFGGIVAKELTVTLAGLKYFLEKGAKLNGNMGNYARDFVKDVK